MKVSAEAGGSADTGFAMLAKTLQVQREEEVSSVQEELRQNTIRLISSTHTTLVKARFEWSLVWLRKKMRVLKQKRGLTVLSDSCVKAFAYTGAGG